MNRLAIRRRLGPAVLAAALACAGSSGAHAGCQIKGLLELPVTMVGSRAIAHVTINGTPVPLLVDSGAPFSSLTDAAAAQLKLPDYPLPWGMRITGITGGAAVMHMTTVDKLQLLGGSVPDVEFLVGGNEPGSGAMGILGRNLLTFTDVEFDLPHGAIRFALPNDECRESNMAYWAGARPTSELPLIRSYERSQKTPPLHARVQLNGKTVLALLDTGSYQTLVAHAAAVRVGVAEAAMTPAGEVYGIGRDRVQAWTAPFGKIEIGDETIDNNRLLVADIELQGSSDEMLLGIDFFLSHRIYVARKQSTLYFTYEGGPVFALNKGAVATAVAFDPPAAASAASAATQAATADQFARRGAAAMARHDYADALADLDRACELAPRSAAYRTQRGLVHELMNRRDDALRDFDQALALDPAEADARLHRAMWRVLAKDRAGALQDLAALDQDVPAQAPVRLEMARLFERLGERAPAITQFDDWIPAHPNDIELPAAQSARCWMRVLLNRDLDKAYADCDDAVDADRHNATFLDHRGWVSLRQQKFKDARKDFDRSLEARPSSAITLYGRAVAQFKLGEQALGEADLDAARKVQPAIDQTMTRLDLALLPPPTPAAKP